MMTRVNDRISSTFSMDRDSHKTFSLEFPNVLYATKSRSLVQISDSFLFLFPSLSYSAAQSQTPAIKVFRESTYAFPAILEGMTFDQPTL